MLLVLVLTASAARHNRLRAYSAPQLQSEEVFHDDFVHDDTQHPEQAVKVNIRDSEARLREAEKDIENLKDRYESAAKAKEDAEKAHEAHLEDVETAQHMVDKLTTATSSVDVYKKSLEEAKATLAKAKDAVNKTDTAATAAAETVKQAQEDLHDRIMALVDAKENRSDAEGAVHEWEHKVAEAHKANETLAEWTKKLNTTLEHHTALEIKVNETAAAFKSVHADWKVAETRLNEAQKIFDIDREQYEEYIGPYPPVPKENLWWDALQDGKWHDDWPHFFF